VTTPERELIERLSYWNAVYFKEKDRSWVAEAKCKGMDTRLFFPSGGRPNKDIRRLCESCSVRKQCQEYGSTERAGIWGGRAAIEMQRGQRNPNGQPKSDSKQKLIDTTRNMIEAGDHCTARSVAERAGVNRGLITYYFGNWDRLQEIAMEEVE